MTAYPFWPSPSYEHSISYNRIKTIFRNSANQLLESDPDFQVLKDFPDLVPSSGPVLHNGYFHVHGLGWISVPELFTPERHSFICSHLLGCAYTEFAHPHDFAAEIKGSSLDVYLYARVQGLAWSFKVSRGLYQGTYTTNPGSSYLAQALFSGILELLRTYLRKLRIPPLPGCSSEGCWDFSKYKVKIHDEEIIPVCPKHLKIYTAPQPHFTFSAVDQLLQEANDPEYRLLRTWPLHMIQGKDKIQQLGLGELV